MQLCNHNKAHDAKRSFRWHPDKNPEQAELAQREFIAVQQAYEARSEGR